MMKIENKALNLSGSMRRTIDSLILERGDN